MSSGLQPFYGASFDDRKGFNTSSLAVFEERANGYKEKRNRAIVMQAECLVKLDQKEEAAAMFSSALGLITIDDREWWTRARLGLYTLIDVK